MQVLQPRRDGRNRDVASCSRSLAVANCRDRSIWAVCCNSNNRSLLKCVLALRVHATAGCDKDVAAVERQLTQIWAPIRDGPRRHDIGKRCQRRQRQWHIVMAEERARVLEDTVSIHGSLAGQSQHLQAQALKGWQHHADWKHSARQI
eukprot:366130-Chlamydomonas_euryale.AAC.15